MFTQHSCNLKLKRVEIIFFLIYGSKKLKGLFLTTFYLRPVAAKMIFSAKRNILPNYLLYYLKSNKISKSVPK